MKFKLINESGEESVHEMNPIGVGKTVWFPLLFEPRVGGRRINLSEVDSEKVIRDILAKCIDMDPDFRAYYFGEIFCQLMSFKEFTDFYNSHFVVNHMIDSDGRFFFPVVEFCERGKIETIDEDSEDLISDLGEADDE